MERPFISTVLNIALSVLAGTVDEVTTTASPITWRTLTTGATVGLLTGLVTLP